MNQTITIISKTGISITNSQGKTISGWTWDGAVLSHPKVSNPWKATPAMAEKITAATVEAAPSRRERLSGREVSRLPEAERGEWEWDGGMDGNGVYTRVVPGRTVTIAYAPADFGK
jgi:hypothetical protein